MPTLPPSLHLHREKKSDGKKISKHHLKVKVLGQTTEGREFLRTGWNICLRSDLGRLQEHIPRVPAFKSTFRSLPNKKCFEDGWSNAASAEDVEDLLVSKLHQNNRSQGTILLFPVNTHFCVYSLPTTILNTI